MAERAGARAVYFIVVNGGRMRSVLNLVMAAVLLAASLLTGRPMTPRGVHCPTAPVQIVRDGADFRAPELGEKEFRQCCCKEKQSGQAVRAPLLSFLPPFTCSAVDLSLRAPIISVGSSVLQASSSMPLDVSDAPLLPPPDWV